MSPLSDRGLQNSASFYAENQWVRVTRLCSWPVATSTDFLSKRLQRVRERELIAEHHLTSICSATEAQWAAVSAISSTLHLGFTNNHNIMGKRKKSSRKPAPSRKKDPLGTLSACDLLYSSHSRLADTTFTCLFCHHDNSVTVKVDRKEGLAQLMCRVCDQRYQSKVNREC